MTEILASIATILLVVIIAAAIVAVCGGIRRDGGEPEPEDEGGDEFIPTEDPQGSDEWPPESTKWVIELLGDGNKVRKRYHVPEGLGQGISVGRSAYCDIQIAGYRDMSRRHLILRSDSNGEYFTASKKCSSTIYVNDRMVYNGKNEPRDTKSSKTYLRSGMMLRLGSARLRIRKIS